MEICTVPFHTFDSNHILALLFSRIYTSVLDTYEHLLPPVLKGSLAVSAFDLFVSGLLFAGLLTRKPALMLPWLATAMLYLSVAAAFVLGLTVIQFTVVQTCSGGLFTMAVGLAFVMVYYYIWKVVQSEWMNIREAATRTGNKYGHPNSNKPQLLLAMPYFYPIKSIIEDTAKMTRTFLPLCHYALVSPLKIV